MESLSFEEENLCTISFPRLYHKITLKEENFAGVNFHVTTIFRQICQI